MTYLTILLKDNRINGIFTSLEKVGLAEFEENFDCVVELGLLGIESDSNWGGLFGKRVVPAWIWRNKETNAILSINIDQKDLWVDFYSKYKKEDETVG